MSLSTSTTATSPQTASAVLGSLVDVLVVQPLDALTTGELQEQIALLNPQLDRLAGWLAAAAGALDARCGGRLPTDEGDGRRSVAGWLAEVRRTTPSAAGAGLRTSRALRQLPLVAAAVLDGTLTPEQAGILTRLVGRIDPAGLADAESAMVQVATQMDPARLAAWVRHEIATHCEPALDADAQAAHDGRFWQATRHPDGTLRGRFRLAAEDSETVLTALEPLARRDGQTDTRSAGQRRADALVDICEQVLRHGRLPDSGGHRPQLTYLLTADWAAAQVAASTCPHCGPRCPQHRTPSLADTVTAGLPGQHPRLDGRLIVPAEHACAVAAWSGPQTRSRMETVLCDARISRVLLDSTGQVQRLESLSDAVTGALRRALAARDGGCVARSCTRPPGMCDVHHLTRRADGGSSTAQNLVLLCRRHHVLWHKGKIDLRHLHVPWHPDAHGPAPDWSSALFPTPTGAGRAPRPGPAADPPRPQRSTSHQPPDQDGDDP